MERTTITGAVRILRTQMTPAERRLWGALRMQKLDGWRFRRQPPIGHFIADFCCPQARLVVEVDGDIHTTPDQRSYDEVRDRLIEESSLRVLRVTNEDVFADLPSVLARIRHACSPQV